MSYFVGKTILGKRAQRQHNQQRPKSDQNQAGFSLLEVIIAIMILAIMVMFIAQLTRASFELRKSLNEKTTVTQRMNILLQKVSEDFAHAYIVSSKDSVRSNGKARTLFKIEKVGDSDRVSMTYMHHQALLANSKESDQSYVVYEIKESKKFPGRKNLCRGEVPRVPLDFKDPVDTAVLIPNVAQFNIEYWNGERWLKDKWDSSSSDTADRMPQMVKIYAKLWVQDPIDENSVSEEKDKGTEEIVTVVYLPYALDFNELKDRVATFSIR